MSARITVILTGDGEYEYKIKNAVIRDGFLIIDLLNSKRTVAYNVEDVFSYEVEYEDEV